MEKDATPTIHHGRPSHTKTWLLFTAIHTHWSRLLRANLREVWSENRETVWRTLYVCDHESCTHRDCPFPGNGRVHYAMQRIVLRRGRPAHIWSDNGTNFIGAAREIQDTLKRLNKERITDELSQHGVQWHFIPPAAPHFGGVWERLVKSAKRALKAVAGNQRVTDETLLKFMAEAESLMNSRPLTHVSSDCNDLEAITPNHFLLGRANMNIPLDVVTDRGLCSRKRWKHAQVMANHFWER